MKTELESAEPEVAEEDLVVKCPIEGCDVLMGTALEEVNGEYEIREYISLRSWWKDEDKKQMLKREWSGRKDLNLRPPGPEPGALARLRYAPTRSSR